MEQKRKSIAGKLTALLDKTRTGYASLQERDRMEQARAGAESIKTRGFAFGDIGAEAGALVLDARAEALALVDKEIESASAALVEAPTTEAANYVSAIAARDNMTSDEVSAALARYTDHATQKAVRTAAARSGLRGYAGMTDVETYMADLRDLRADVARTYNPDSFGNVTGGMAAITAAGYKSFAENPGGGAMGVLACLGAD